MDNKEQQDVFETAKWDASRVRSAEQGMPASARPHPQSAHTGKKKRRKKKHRFLRFLLWLIFVVVSSVLLAEVGWLLANDMCAFNKPPMTVTIEVERDDTVESIADKLKESGLIEYKWFFRLFGKVAHADQKIGIGSYTLNSDMDYHALINGMKSRIAKLDAETVKVSIPEGYTVRQIIALLAEKGVNTEEALTKAAESYEFDYTFLDSSLEGDVRRLEGYLFPDTYEFFVGENAGHALNRLLENFDTKVNDDIVEEIEGSDFTLPQIITIASLIEKETDGTDRDRISSVIHNRLSKKGETYYLLQIDASQIYGLGDDYTGALTKEELDIDTPYNTHLHTGLPPTPIANPGINSIRAALEPANTRFFFYALGTDKLHHFFETYAEHTAFVNSGNYGG